MGLDISFYKGLKKANGIEGFDEDGEVLWEEDWTQLYVNPDYPERAPEISNGCAYKSEDGDGFCAGAYSGYNRWREQLAQLAGYAECSYEEYGNTRTGYAMTVWKNPVDGPFMELINFSDCEGVIGAGISKKLAIDFSEFQEKASNHEDERFKRLYGEWRKAFEMAADNGCVEFR